VAGECHAVILRSPHAHAEIRGIDTAAAREAPGVIAVLTGAELAADGIGGIPSDFTLPFYPPRAGPPFAVFHPPFPALARERARYVGEGVAMIVAETLEAARDAAELVEIDYEPLDPVTGTEAAAADAAPQLWPEAPGNTAFLWEAGDRAATAAAFARAHRVARVKVVNSRIIMAALETRGAIGEWDAAAERFTLHTASQMPHGLRHHLAGAFHLAEDRIRVLIGDVGGGFGLKNAVYPEYILVLWAARRLGRAVRWIGERGEAFSPIITAATNVSEAEMALDAEGKFLGLRVATLANLGAYLAPKGLLSPTSNTPGLSGSYRTPAMHVTVRGIFSNTVPTDVYRGAGRPEAFYLLERLVDAAARELGIDPAKLRRRNMVKQTDMPFRTPLGLTYDHGDLEKVLDAALAKADWAGFSARRAASAQKRHVARHRSRPFHRARRRRLVGGGRDPPRRRGQGDRLSRHHVERPGPRDRLCPDDRRSLRARHRRGRDRPGRHRPHRLRPRHWRLGLDPDRRRGARHRHDQGDREGPPHRRASARDRRGRYRVRRRNVHRRRHRPPHRAASRRPLRRTMRRSGRRGPKRASPIAGFFKPGGPTYPNGCHICEVEIDPETGVFAILRYTLVHDFGRILNPMLLEGQLHGGIAMGLGQAGFERVVFDPESGQPLAASFMDYAPPRADDLPFFAFAHETTPSANPLGVKGCGEAGATAARRR